MTRTLLVGLGCLGLVACADAATVPTLPDARSAPVASVGNPPPPPVDGIANPVLPCVRLPDTSYLTCYITLVGEVDAQILRAPGGNTAFVQLSSADPDVVVSPDAMVRENPQGLSGHGTITAEVPFLGTVVVHLETVRDYPGSLLGAERHVGFAASITDPQGNPIVRTGTIEVRYVAAIFTYAF